MPARPERPDPGAVRVIRDRVGMCDLKRAKGGKWAARLVLDVELLLPDGRSVIFRRTTEPIGGKQAGVRPGRGGLRVRGRTKATGGPI